MYVNWWMDRWKKDGKPDPYINQVQKNTNTFWLKKKQQQKKNNKKITTKRLTQSCEFIVKQL